MKSCLSGYDRYDEVSFNDVLALHIMHIALKIKHKSYSVNVQNMIGTTTP